MDWSSSPIPCPLSLPQVLKFWRANNPKFSSWAIAARMVFAIKPSSASVERVFSLLKSMFKKEQLSSLADLVQGSIILNYNQPFRWTEREPSVAHTYTAHGLCESQEQLEAGRGASAGS